MWKEIGRAFSLLGSGQYSKDCRCIILRGEGKGFCGGIDISDPSFGASEEADEADTARQYLSFQPQILQMQECLSSIETKCPYPVIAAIHGSCIGAGVDLVCCTDIRLCAPHTIFGVREAALGLAADVGTLQRFPKIVGHGSRVRELCITGQNFDSIEAERIGFVSRISKTDQSLMNEAMEIANKIVANSPVAVVGTKMSMVYSRDHSVQEGLKHVAMHNAAALITDDLGLSLMSKNDRNSKNFENLLPHARL